MKAEAAMAPPAPPQSAASPPRDAAPSAVPGLPAAVVATPESVTPTQEMLDIEANASLEVAQVKPALRSLRELAARVGGVVTSERVDAASGAGSAELTLRVPSRAAAGVFQELEKLGKVVEQTVTARDVGKEYFDANLRLTSLEAALRRYEEILAQATKVDDLLRIEQEIARVRGEIEEIKGNLRWLKDRAARATLHLTLRERAPVVADSPKPEAKFYPGLRVGTLFDFSRRADRALLGGGFSLRFSRQVSVDLDLYEPERSEVRGPDVVLVTLGGELYSELLGGGERRFLNPYVGWRIGYARFGDQDQALLGASLGVELFKSPWFGLDLEARNYVAFLDDAGARYALAPTATAKLAF